MSSDRRVNLRRSWIMPGTVTNPGNPDQACIISDFSNDGAKLHVRAAVLVPNEFTLRFSPERGPPRDCRVLWRTDHQLGIQFV